VFTQIFALRVGNEPNIVFLGGAIGEFMYTPYKHLSSGMKVRIAFAVISRVEQPIILVGEVLAAGDKRFREKCDTRIEELLAGRRTLFFVSHSERDLRRVCTRGLDLDEGKLVPDAPIKEVLGRWLASSGTVGGMAKKTEIIPAGPMMVRGIDRVLTVQRPAVLAHIRSIRRGRPAATPAAIIRTLESRYLAAVTTSGAVVGASAAIPAVGTGTALALSAAETAAFLEASALFAQSITEIHGIVVDDPDRARALVMTMVLGTAGSNLVKQLAGQAAGTGPVRTAYWGELVTKSIPRSLIGPIADRIKSSFLKRFALSQSTNVVGRLIPFGIGAVIGGGGNHLLGRQIVRTAREGFGPAPTTFPVWLEPVIKLPREPKTPKAPRAPRVRKTPKAPRVRKTPESPKTALKPAADD